MKKAERVINRLRVIRRNMMEVPGKAIGTIALFIVGMLIFGFSFNKWMIANRLDQKGVTTSATVIIKDDFRYQTSEWITYRFEVVGSDGKVKIYERGIHVPYDIYRQIEINSPIEIRYLPANPKKSDITARDIDYFSMMLCGVGGMFYGSVLFIMYVVLRWQNYTTWRRRWLMKLNWKISNWKNRDVER